MAISVIIPSYRNPSYLDLCLRSAFQHKVRNDNQIIVVLDGYVDESAEIVEQYPGLNVIAFEENRGQQIAHNYGVSQAEHDRILIVNDDNVFPPQWDMWLEQSYRPNRVIAPNQIEPAPSMFRSFIHKDFGTTPETFDMEAYVKFCDAENFRSDRIPYTSDGQTWPVFMSKKWYMVLGGIDPLFPSPAVADWDFFMRCEMAGLEMVRCHTAQFYHFAGAATKRDAETARRHAEKEMESFDYFRFKWGFNPGLDLDNRKVVVRGEMRGIL